MKVTNLTVWLPCWLSRILRQPQWWSRSVRWAANQPFSDVCSINFITWNHYHKMFLNSSGEGYSNSKYKYSPNLSFLTLHIQHASSSFWLVLETPLVRISAGTAAILIVVFSVAFLSLSQQMPGEYLKITYDCFLHILSNSLSFNHSTLYSLSYS
jgi:hypothetical protein